MTESCAVCGGQSPRSYTAYSGDKPIACQHGNLHENPQPISPGVYDQEWPLTKDHRCGLCMCFMPWHAQALLAGKITKDEYEAAYTGEGRFRELMMNHNRVLEELREAKKQIKTLRRGHG